MRLVPIMLACALALAGCAAEEVTPPQTDVGRNFDALASAVAACAETLRTCGDEEDAGKAESAKCRDEFVECRGRAGKPAETELAEAIGSCKEQHGKCQNDAGESECAQALRDCIGEARSQAKDSSDAAAPNSHAPTYQCFGQLRECVTSSSEPRECAAQARACVIAAVGDPPEVRRPNAGQPAAAGSGGRGEAGKGSAGAGTGAGGAAGSRATAGAGAGGSAGSKPPPVEPTDCMKQHAACLMSGEMEKKCMRELRMCEKQDP
jgi:hypothetical protein